MATPSSIHLGESHGQRNIAGYSPWAFKELDNTEQLNNIKMFSLKIASASWENQVQRKTPHLEILPQITECTVFSNILLGFSASSVVKEFACNVGERVSVHGSDSSPGGRNGSSLQYSFLENPMDRRAWWAAVHGVAKSQTWFSNPITNTLLLRCPMIPHRLHSPLMQWVSKPCLFL